MVYTYAFPYRPQRLVFTAEEDWPVLTLPIPADVYGALLAREAHDKEAVVHAMQHALREALTHDT